MATEKPPRSGQPDESQTSGPTSVAGKRVLVVGDWIVDDNWVLGIQRSATSSRTGKNHYQAQHKDQSSVQAFCGAGRTAEVIHQRRHEASGEHQIIGLGIWNNEDTDLLRQMFLPGLTCGQTPFRLTVDVHKSPPPRIDLVNLIKCFEITGETIPSHGTARIIRIYQHTGTKVINSERIDWAIYPQTKEDGGPAWIVKPGMLDPLKDRFGQVDVVVIKDLLKGVISRSSVQWLANNFAEAEWYVSTKAWRPAWMPILQTVNLKLLVLPQIACRLATKKEDQLNSWLTSKGRPSKEALSQMGRILEDLDSNGMLRVVALPEGLSCIAVQKDRERERTTLILQPEAEPHTRSVSVSMASICFGALVTQLIDADPTLEELVEMALSFSNEWQDAEVKRFETPHDWNPASTPRLDLDEKRSFKGLQKLELGEEMKRWDAALKNLGFVTYTGPGTTSDRRIELWRSMTEIDGYVCCVPHVRRRLARFVKELKQLNDLRPSHQVSCLLYAEPGSGKTHLARCVAAATQFRLLPFNITQMISHEDILDLFDTIIATHAQARNEQLMVFIDEFNAKIQNQHVYGTFLSPLEDGLYVRGGKTFTLPPCLWVFAGTDDITAIKTAPKGEDLISRLTLGQIDLRAAQHNMQYIQNVYLGVSLILNEFPDVRYITEKVLRIFKDMSGGVNVRQLRRFVKSFRYVQSGIVQANNVAVEGLAELGIDPVDWANLPESPELIEITL